MDRATEYADGNVEFSEWLQAVDSIVSSRIGLSVFDLEDMMFRDEFDAGTCPEDFISETVVDTVRDNYGEEYASLLEA